MLQQTTVETVIPYYERFLKQFPTVQILAESTEEEVLKHWSGLGYYSRARNLHKSAQMLAPPPLKKGGRGDFPRTVEELQNLPGIGRYTAGAIASIAFDQRAPLVDGNVIRVFSRLFAVSKDPKTTEGQKLFWKIAEKSLPQKHCGDFNQALMELGATVCSPENPACSQCPVASSCRARKMKSPEKFPKGKKKVLYRKVLLSAAVIQENEKFLLSQRQAKGLLKGMWEFPMVEGDGAALGRALSLQILKQLPSVRHSVLNQRLEITPYLCRLKKEAKAVEEGTQRRRWVSLHEFEDLAMSSMNRKILKRLEV